MAGQTPNYNLTTLNANDDFNRDGYKFTDADRVLVDRLLHAALNHDHSGAPPGDPGETIDTAPTLTLDPTTGSLPAGVRLYYRIALIGPDGIPSVASPETMIDTPQPVTAPGPPTAQRSTTGGTLRPGVYYYRVSAYRTADTLETAAGDAVTVNLPATAGSTQRILLTLPTLPTGATGLNIYRRVPGGAAYHYVASIDLADIETQWIDTGALDANCERFAPSANTTSSSNSIEIGYPGGTIPVGYTWRIYRSDLASDWTNSLLVDVIEETSEGSGIITPTYTDMGIGTSAGTPPMFAAPTIVTPPQIDYTDLTGTPPTPASEATATIHVPDANITGIYDYQWVSPFDEAIIRSVHANLGVGATPVGTDLQVTVERYDPVDDWVPVTDGAISIAIGDNIADPTPLATDVPVLTTGDQIRLYFDQAGGATATDLVVTVLLWTRTTGPAPEWPEPGP
jgi:hypothetical protein